MKNLIDNEKAELVCLTETWLTKHQPKYKNYECEWKHRPAHSGEGLGILIKNNLQYKIINLIPFHNGVIDLILKMVLNYLCLTITTLIKM